MPAAVDYVSLVEACYRASDSDQQWLEDVMDAARPVFERGLGYGFSMQEISDGQTRPTLTAYRGLPLPTEDIRSRASELDEQSFDVLWHPPRPIVYISQLLPKLPHQTAPMMSKYVEDCRVGDMLGLVGYPTTSSAFVLWSGVKTREPLSGHRRDTLHRLRLHLETGLRLRAMGGSSPVAVFSPDGRLQHLGGPDTVKLAPELLARHAMRLDRVRAPTRRHRDDEALAAWNALVDGAWSLVEREEEDGRRFYYAFENAPCSVAHRALTQRENVVLDLNSKGLPGKHVAYALGISEGAISQSLEMAALKLGIRSRLALLKFAAGMRKQEPLHEQTDSLTPSERHVLSLVKQGLTNRAIAKARGASERTVANQLQSILKKTHASGRRDLITRDLLPKK